MSLLTRLNPVTAKLSLWWNTAKLWVYLSVFVIGMVWSFHQGKQSCQTRALKAVEKELDAAEERTAKAVARAGRDATKLSNERASAREIKDEIEALPAADPVCKPSDDELRVLRTIQEGSRGG